MIVVGIEKELEADIKLDEEILKTVLLRCGNNFRWKGATRSEQ